jgi:excisionase family DNA binding protein
MKYTASQAAELLGVHPNTICTWIRQGKLVADRPGHFYLIDETAIALFRETHLQKSTDKGGHSE